MDDSAIENATIAIANFNARDPEEESDNSYSHEAVSSNGEGMRELGSAGEVLTRVELDLAYSSEKLLNLDILLMDVRARESDFEALTIDDDNILADSVEKAVEFDLLSGILDSELGELDNFMESLQREIMDARQKISLCEHLRDTSPEMEEKLHDAEASLKQSKDQVSEIRKQSARLQRTLLAFTGQENWNGGKGADSENGQFSNMNAKLKMQTAEQQRHILRMLEKSLARELDLEKKLSESRQSEEELKFKLRSTEQEVFCVEEAAEVVWERLFEAENAAEVLMGISKELMGRLQIVQFNLNGSIQREGETRSRLQDCMEQIKSKEGAFQKRESTGVELDNFLLSQTTNLEANLKEAEDKYILANSEVFTLKEKVHLLEEQLKESEIRLQNAKAPMEASQEQQYVLYSEIKEMENVIEDLKENISKAESRAESAETKCTLLTETNLELHEELGFHKSSGNNMEKVNMLEKQLRESDIQLQHAKVSAEASQEQQNMLYSAIGDMENLIEDLKSKVSKAESRAESTETKCILLSETNMELVEELNFLRGRMECLESSLHKADSTKIATAKDIGIRTKVITDLAMQLARERERLQKQISSLTKENKVLVEKLFGKKKDVPVPMSCQGNGSNKESLFSEDDLIAATHTKVSKEAVTESSATSFQVNKSLKEAPLCVTEVEPTISAKDAVSDLSKSEIVRTIEAGQLKTKYVFMAIVIVLISGLAMYLLQQESCPF